jgi:hypothetical protein
MRMIRSRHRLALAAIVLTGACSHKIPPTAPRHIEITDPAGDAVKDATVAVAPDLVRATVDVAAGTLTFVVGFAPGTFDRGSTRVTIQLDTDLNPATGIHTTTGLGIDYVIDVWSAGNRAQVLKAVGASGCGASMPCYVPDSDVDFSLVPNGVSVSVPVSRLSGDGRLNFRIVSYAMAAGASGPITVAHTMPDLTQPPAHVP